MLPLLALFACDDSLLVDDKKTPRGEDDTGPIDVGDLCAESAPATTSIPVVFDAYDDGCPWGEDGNLETEDAHCTARVEQVETVDIGTGAVICDVTFDFRVGGGEAQRMVYDDNFFLTFDDVVLAASYGPYVDLFPRDGDLPIYDWDSIVGQPFEFGDIPTYCLGEDEGLATCTIPAPETNGPIALQFDATIIEALSTRAVELGRVDYGFITFGDNDASTDCSHEEFSFEVEISYVER